MCCCIFQNEGKQPIQDKLKSLGTAIQFELQHIVKHKGSLQQLQMKWDKDAKFQNKYLSIHVIGQTKHICIYIQSIRDDNHRPEHNQSCPDYIKLAPMLRLVVNEIRYEHSRNRKPEDQITQQFFSYIDIFLPFKFSSLIQRIIEVVILRSGTIQACASVRYQNCHVPSTTFPIFLQTLLSVILQQGMIVNRNLSTASTQGYSSSRYLSSTVLLIFLFNGTGSLQIDSTVLCLRCTLAIVFEISHWYNYINV